MKGSLARHCPQCKSYGMIEIEGPKELFCPFCSMKWGEVKNAEDIFDRCPVCAGRQFYLSKDFNQFLGCVIMGMGIVLVPITYGLSLPVFALIDWLLYKRVQTIVGCYKCATEFRGFPPRENFRPFMHHIGLKYDKYR